MQNELISHAEVLARPAWNAQLVEQLLGEPDATRMADGLLSFLLVRVLDAEQGAAFARLRLQIARIERMLALGAQGGPLVEQRPYEQVWRAAVVHHNRLDSDPISESAPQFVIERITVNYIRHELSNYDAAMWEATAIRGGEQVVQDIRRRVYANIAKLYPMLAEECARQLQARG
ncbi:MAG: hypothetical protein ACRC2B_08915 [Rubrivivax sp.]